MDHLLKEIAKDQVLRTLCLEKAKNFLDDLISLLFPCRNTTPLLTQKKLAKKIEATLISILASFGDQFTQVQQKRLAEKVFLELPKIRGDLQKDAVFILAEDPACASLQEVYLCYPGFYAISAYRISHLLYRLKIPLLPRALCEYAHEKTGIDIHPGAKIGCPLFVDHGTGVVIGETTIIGDSVKIYQGVTLGALSVAKDMQGAKRHPTIEDHCVIYANATILGGATVVGEDSVVGGNVWLTESVAKRSFVYHRGEVIKRKKQTTRSSK